MSFTHRGTKIVKGMLKRGDKQHDMAAFFGVNGGRIAEVLTGECDYPSTEPLSLDELPPKPPYPSPDATLKAKQAIEDLVRNVGKTSDPVEAKELAVKGLWKIIDEMK